MDTSIYDHPVLFSFRCIYIEASNAFEGSFDTIVSQNGKNDCLNKYKRKRDCWQCTHSRGSY